MHDPGFALAVGVIAVLTLGALVPLIAQVCGRPQSSQLRSHTVGTSRAAAPSGSTAFASSPHR